MLTLHQTTDQLKTMIRWIGIGIGGLILLVFVFRIISAIHKAITPPPKPTVTFGKLPSIVFPQYQKQDNTTYSIDTVSGALPALPDRMFVYKIQQPTPTLQNLTDARKKIGLVGFNTTYGQSVTENPLSETRYQWTDSDAPPRVITMDIDTFNFVLSTSLMASLTPDSSTLISQGMDATSGTQLAQKFMNDMGLFPADIDTAQTKTQLIRNDNNALVKADLSNAQAVRVDFFQKDLIIKDETINKYNVTTAHIYYPNPNYSLIDGIVVPYGGNPQLAALSYYHHTVTDESATYPIISVQQAYNELKSGNAYIAQHDTNTSINIKEVELGYFLSNQHAEYMLPIYVFKGDATPSGDYNFYAYVPAVTSDWIQGK